MDPGRIHAYLQAACAGLGFDIGEVWFSSNDTGTSTVAQIESQRHNNDIKFLQLYTSRSYKNRRNDLLRPTSEGASNEKGNKTDGEEITKHVLSPKLVNAIADTAQVVWANCQEREGLLGRSDMRLQTAVGMPVAMDSDGNMCIVVMFSPKNVQSNQNAVEYLKSLSEGATSTSIPCLLPVMDTKTKKLEYNPKRFSEWEEHDAEKKKSSNPEKISNIFQINDLSNDFFGIPMLPAFAELDVPGKRSDASSASGSDDGAAANAFDQASYGLWSTIMENPETSTIIENIPDETTSTAAAIVASTEQQTPPFHPERKSRLEEFSDAFLAMSVFDIADFWVPSSSNGVSQYLHHVFSLSSDDDNTSLNYFKSASVKQVVNGWSGAIGRAFCSGNAVWSTNTETIVDIGRTEAFAIANIKTALAVPIYSTGSASPCCVLCFYAMVRSDCVPFVLKFVEQALRSLWLGLECLQPDQNIGTDLWKDVAPADLGAMAADLEMQKAFYQKKRPYDAISSKPPTSRKESNFSGRHVHGKSSSLSLQLQGLPPPSGEMSTSLSRKSAQKRSLIKVATVQPQQFRRSNSQTSLAIQNHLQEAIKSVSSAMPISYYQGSAVTNATSSFTTSPSPSSFIPPKPILVKQESFIPSNPNLAQRESCIPQNPHLTQQESFIPQNQNFAQQESFIPHNQNLAQPEYISNATNYTNGVHSITPGIPSDLLEPSKFSPSQNNTTPINGQLLNTFQGQPLHQPLLRQQHQIVAQDPIPLTTPSAMFPPNIIAGNQEQPNVLMPSAMIPFCSSVTNSDAVFASQPNIKNARLVCRIQGCDKLSAPRKPYCTKHSGNRICEHPDCTKCAQGATRFCIGHGGGRRCTYPNCDKGARDKFFCAAHGGGKRCKFDGCKKSAVGGSHLCTSHGGGRRCAIDGCEKSAQSSTKFCVKHGGGKKCAHPDCEKVARGRTRFCAGHGGGVRCKLEGCSRIAIGKLQLCRAHGGGSSTLK